MLVGQYGGGGSAHYSGSFMGRNTFSGASTSSYHGIQKYPLIGGGYVPYYGAYALGVPYSPYYYGTFGMPPLFVPADTLFGPGPLMQNIGNLAPADDGGRGANLPPGPKKVRATNAASKARAGKFLQSGDTQFGKQKFHQALERYREGAVAAPDVADCFFRQAFAQIAMGQYEAASKAIQRGLRLKPDWADSDFTLVSLYGAEHHLTKLSHREALAQAIEQSPLDASLHLAMGAMLYFDGEQERSRLFFERAAQLGANDDHQLDGFLAPRPAGAEKVGADKADVEKGPAKLPGRADL
jgi:tetratricopeptide (TPR) repeat protein